MGEVPSDAFDLVDLKLVHALEVAGRAPFSRIAEALGVSDQTVARRFRKLRSSVGLRVVGARDGIRLGQEEWLLRLRCTPDGSETIARALARRPDTTWITVASAGTEVFCRMRVRSRGEYEDLILAKLPRTPTIVGIHAYQFLHRFFGGPSSWLEKTPALTPQEAAQLRDPVGEPEAAAPVRITEDDEPLVRALERDGRTTYPELARVTGRSETAVRRRLSQLIGSGAVYLDVEYAPDRFGFGTRAFLWVTAVPSALRDVGEALARHPEVSYVGAIAGGPCNLVAVVATRDSHELFRYLTERFGSLPGVAHAETSPVLWRVKQLAQEQSG
ncbi:Lrp/AsnC family transcriptional regulator [Streptomyces sp. NPDC005263]|uniref:Lrp/AsnC family transcriptional regulator n=1 Tax=Streptomyces sp. NPDC005263 TaxID=3364711 RepID=UPI00368A4E18